MISLSNASAPGLLLVVWAGLGLGCNAAVPEPECTPDGDQCRGDEICTDNTCLLWTETSLWANFSVTTTDGDDLARTFEVIDGGFPKQFVEHISFNLGDGFVGWGESVYHSYDGPGLYPVELEVTLTGYRVLRASQLIVVGDPEPPIRPMFLTLNAIEENRNGSIPYTTNNNTTSDTSDDYEADFHLLVPPSGFAIDLTQWHHPNDPVDTATLSLTANAPFGDIAAGDNLIGFFEFTSDSYETIPKARWTVPPSHALAPAMVELTLTGTTIAGVDFASSLEFEVTEFGEDKNPLSHPITWLLRFDMDYFSLSSDVDALGGIALYFDAEPNGTPDFEEELLAIGAQGNESAAGCDTVMGNGQVGANAIYRQWVKDAVVRETLRYFDIQPDGTPLSPLAMTITHDQTLEAPDPATFDRFGDFSIMRMGGTMPTAIGYSLITEFNACQVDNSTARLGVATGDIIGSVVATPALTNELDPIKPTIGTPVGEDSSDATVLADSFDRWAKSNTSTANDRYDTLMAMAKMVGLAIANVTAHEMGHAMGLVPNGPPPSGFFANRDDVTFVADNSTDSHHVNLPGLNLMQAGGNILTTLTEALDIIEAPRHLSVAELATGLAMENRFSSYSMAYLRGQLTYESLNTLPSLVPIGCEP